MPYLSVRSSGDGDGRLDILGKAQPGNQVGVNWADGRAIRSLSGISVSSGIRFTRFSHSLIMGSSSRSNMSATLANFNFVNAVLLYSGHAFMVVSHTAILESVQNRPNRKPFG